MKDWTVTRFIVLGLLATVIAWLAAPFLTLAVVQVFPDARLGSYGSSGDMFGAATALFSGLGFFGVALVLYIDIRARREDLTLRKHSRTPFLVPSLVDRGARMVRATKIPSGLTEAVLVLELSVENVSAEPAMNVELVSRMLGTPSLDAHTTIENTPFGVGDSAKRRATAHVSATGPAAEALLRELADGRTVRVEVGLEYDSINATRWSSKVVYVLTPEADSRAAFRSILDGNERSFITEGGGFDRPSDEHLSFEVEKNSWQHDVLDHES